MSANKWSSKKLLALIIAASAMALAFTSIGCGGSANVVVPPNTGSHIDVPSELLEIYARYVAERNAIYPNVLQIPYGFAYYPLKERRARVYYDFSMRDEVGDNVIECRAEPGPTGWLDPIAERARLELGALWVRRYDIDHGVAEYIFVWDHSLTRSQLAWYGDWLLQHYSSCFLLAAPTTSSIPVEPL